MTFTAAQLASVVDFKEARDYIGKLYKETGAPMDVRFSSPAPLVRASNGIGAVIAHQQSREDHILKSQASAERSSDPIIQMYQDDCGHRSRARSVVARETAGCG